jgi:hypothetical protein
LTACPSSHYRLFVCHNLGLFVTDASIFGTG